jgi:hypothetical protein
MNVLWPLILEGVSRFSMVPICCLGTCMRHETNRIQLYG